MANKPEKIAYQLREDKKNWPLPWIWEATFPDARAGTPDSIPVYRSAHSSFESALRFADANGMIAPGTLASLGKSGPDPA